MQQFSGETVGATVLPEGRWHTQTQTHTCRSASLPSERLLAAASNPLHLPLVHSASEAASLVRSVPSLTTSHMDHRHRQRCPSQQHLGQISWRHRSVWLPPFSTARCVVLQSRQSREVRTWIGTKSRRKLQAGWRRKKVEDIKRHGTHGDRKECMTFSKQSNKISPMCVHTCVCMCVCVCACAHWV